MTGKSGPARSGRSPRDTVAATLRLFGSRNQGGGTCGACAKVPDRQLMQPGVVLAPLSRVRQTLSEHSDIESELTSANVHASSSCVSRSINNVERPSALSSRATCWLRELRLLLPLP